MKHNLTITFLLLAAFLIAQFLGILIVNNYIDPIRSAEEGRTIFKELPIGERPPVEEGTSFIPIILTILLGTGLLLLLLKYNLEWIWKLWFTIAVIMALTISFRAFVISEVAFALALIFGIWKIFKPNLWIQTLTELFIYGGLAAIFAPIFNLWSIVILLILISIYDAYAVLKSKHMVTLAQSQTKLKIFAGLLIPYQLPKKSTFTPIKETSKEANKKTNKDIKITKIRLFEATTDFVRGFTLLTTKADFRIRNGGRLITDFVRGLKPTPFLIMNKHGGCYLWIQKNIIELFLTNCRKDSNSIIMF